VLLIQILPLQNWQLFLTAQSWLNDTAHSSTWNDV
jgi:hypothetical protein